MLSQLWVSLQRLAPLGPGFVSVTCGADGSTRDRTQSVVTEIQARWPLAAAAHLTCVGATRAEIIAVAMRYWDRGVRRLIALRGDAPGGVAYQTHPGGFATTAELVAALKRVADFEISVAAYPEKHPDSPSPAADVENLKQKCVAGATRAITQFFFDAEQFLRFRDTCVRAGIRVPLVPGILPIVRLSQVARFAARCGATIPPRIAALFDGIEDDAESHRRVSTAVAVDLIERLRKEGVAAFHFYTLNRAELTYDICHALGLRMPARTAARDLATS